MTKRALTIGLAALLLAGCGKKKEEEPPLPPPPPRGAASADELTTQIGSARGLDEALAPTSVTWTRVFAIDDKHALIAGDVVGSTIALLTDDGGATWRSLKSDREAWSSWGVGGNGAIVLGIGARDGASSPTSAALAAARLSFATFDEPSLSSPIPLFPTASGPVDGVLQTESAVPAALAPGSAALVSIESPRKAFIYYGGKPGAEAVPPLKLPPGEKVVPVPYGRPPSLLTVKGHDLDERPFPAAGKPLDKPIRVPGLVATATLLAELSMPPSCEAGGWSFQLVKQPKGLAVLGISPEKTVVVPLPDGVTPTTRIGCGSGRVVVEAVAAKTGPPQTWPSQPDVPTILGCDLAGKCVTPQNAPFRPWPEQHKRSIVTTVTEQGIVGVMSVRAGDRWGLYLAQGPGEGAVYERQRALGEGTGARGRIDLGAVVSFGKRVLLLVSSDVAGTTRRGWFVMVSDDGGTNWGPP